MAKRGVALGGAALTGLLTSEASAAVPETLLPSILATVKTAAAATATATGASTTAGMLAKGAMKAMFIAQVKMAAVAVVVTGTAVPVGIAVAQAVGKADSEKKAPEAIVVRPETAPRTPVTNGDTNSIDIMGKSMTCAQGALCATYEGDVQVTATQFPMTADRVLTFFKNTNQLSRIEAFGHVVFRQPERQITCDKAVYEKAEAKVTLTGTAVMTGTTAVTRGEDSITASELVLNLNDNHVTTSGGSKVQVHP